MTTANNTARAAAIMSAAHEMTRKIRKQYPAADYRVTFAAALRIAWKETGKSAREIWTAYSGAEQAEYLQRMTAFEYKRRDARCTKDGKRLPNVFTWIDPAHIADDLQAVTNEAYIRVCAMLDDPRHEDKSLQRIISRAIIRAAEYISRAERRNATAKVTMIDDDGQELDAIDIYASVSAARPADPDSAAILRDRIDRAAKDDKDRAIIRLLALEYSARQIADMLNMSHTAINKQISGIRSRAAD